MKVPRPLAIALWPFSLMYGFAAQVRAWLYARGWVAQKRLSKPVISVGNLTVGGTGKTPMVIWLAERFVAEGKRVGILSRGYKGTLGTSDEIELMKARLDGRAVFGVGPDRYSEGLKLEAAGVDIFLLDDGFQHLQLARDVDVVLVDATRPLRQELLLPSGRLREPTSALSRANVVVFTRTGPWLASVRAIQKFPELPIYPSNVKLVGFRSYNSENSVEDPRIAPRRLFGFCGIGNPDAFFDDLRRWGLQIVGTHIFPDHHRYTKKDANKLEDEVARAGAEALVTTEKDSQNIPKDLFGKVPVEIAVINIEITDEREFMRDLRQRLTASRERVA